MGVAGVAGEAAPHGLNLLPLPDLCDVVYVLWVDRLERLALAEQQMTMTLLAAAASSGADAGDLSFTSFDERVAELDAWLGSPLMSAAEPVDVKSLELRRVLGLPS